MRILRIIGAALFMCGMLAVTALGIAWDYAEHRRRHRGDR